MPLDLAELKRQFRAAKRNLRISQAYWPDRPSSIPTRIPVKGKFNHVSQQGITLVSRARLTELHALRPTLRIPTDPIEAEKWKAVWAADREAALLCAKGHQLYGGSREHWISGKTGVLLSEVRYILRK